MNNKIPGMFAVICAPFLYNNLIVSAKSITLDINLFAVVFIVGLICNHIALKRIEVRGNIKPRSKDSQGAAVTALKVDRWKQYIITIISFSLPPNVSPVITSGINFIASTYSPAVLRKLGVRIV